MWIFTLQAFTTDRYLKMKIMSVDVIILLKQDITENVSGWKNSIRNKLAMWKKFLSCSLKNLQWKLRKKTSDWFICGIPKNHLY